MISSFLQLVSKLLSRATLQNHTQLGKNNLLCVKGNKGPMTFARNMHEMDKAQGSHCAVQVCCFYRPCQALSNSILAGSGSRLRVPGS